MTGYRSRFVLLLSIMVGISLITVSMMTLILYRFEFYQQEARLQETVQSQARLYEAVARYDARHAEVMHSDDLKYDPFEATLKQIRDAHASYEQSGQTLEFTLARQVGDSIIFLIKQRHGETDLPESISITSDLAEPQRLALQGQSGIVVGLDYGGELVLAAYEFVKVLDLGVVAKIDIAEIRTPFIRAVYTGGIVTLLLILVGAIIFFKITNPVIQRLEDYTKNLLAEISERKRVEEVLRDRETHLSLIYSTVGDVLYMINVEQNNCFRYISVNPPFLAVTGLTEDQIIGKRIEELIPESSINMTKENYLKAINEGRPIRWEETTQYPSGQKTGIVRVAPVFNEEGRCTHLIGSVHDITQRKIVEEALRSSEELNRSITESATEGIISIDSDGYILLWNQAAQNMFGYPATDMLGQDLSNIIPALYKNSHQRALQRLEQGGESKLLGKIIEISAMRKDGSEFPIELSLSSWKDYEKKTYFTGIIRDISERKQAESEIINALSKAEKANAVKDQFIANISHEIRTPLTSIIGFTALLKKSLGAKVKAEEQVFFNYINQSSNRLLRTVDSILNISQLEAGAIKLTPGRLKLANFTRLICEELRQSAEEKGLQLQFSSSVEDDTVYVDEFSVSQSLHNLIHNAVKYTHTGRISVQLERVQKRLVLAITDSGIGISDEYRQHMFLPFSQESEGFTKNYQGIGLGLAITKKYLDLNQVDLEVVSEKGQGTTFTLIFPENRGTEG